MNPEINEFGVVSVHSVHARLLCTVIGAFLSICPVGDESSPSVTLI